MAIDENKDVEHDNYLRLIVMQRVIQFNRTIAIAPTLLLPTLATQFRVCSEFAYILNTWKTAG